MKKIKTKQLAITGLMAALTMMGTMIIQIPTPTKGYLHLGDSLVYLSGILLGPLVGALAAGIGSTLADVFSGYGIYAPATFIIKSLDALVVGYCYKAIASKTNSLIKKTISFILGIILGGSIMVSGYLAYETFLYGFPAALLGGVPLNITQAIGGGVLALPLMFALEKFNFSQNLK
ncbi:MAG TPA: ECF transporter S component [Clostridia bacterium]|jgi:uncharacterized membrane protein|nr:ECF transporter S component [Clostridia bacterium]HHY06015.1 ECF transporter S component [Clostridia bacterium]